MTTFLGRGHTIRQGTWIFSAAVFLIASKGSNVVAFEKPQQAFDAIAAHLLDQDFGKALFLSTDLTEAIPSEKHRQIKDAVETVATMPEILLTSFAAQRNQVITLQLNQQPARIRIGNILDDGTIEAAAQIVMDGRVVGEAPRTFRLHELDAVEKYRRLGDEPGAERDVMRGLLAYEYGNSAAAARFFSEAGPPLGPMLVRQIEIRREREILAEQERERTRQKEGLRNCYHDMLRTAGLPVDGDPETTVIALRRKALNEAQVAQIHRGLEQFNELKATLGDTQFERRHAAVIETLTQLTPGIAMEIDPDAFKEALDALAAANPHEILQPKHTLTDDGVILDLSRHGALSDLSPLAGSRIIELDLSDTGVTDLRPLRGMPIRRLTLFRTEVSDLRPLRNMPLEFLDIRLCTKLEDIRPLQGMLLTELRAGQHTLISDLTPLRGMPLQTLDLSYGRNIRDIAPLRGLPLKQLNVQNTSVTDIQPLQGMQITHLSLSGTRITDISPLEGMPLRHLSLPPTVQNLAPIRNIQGLSLQR